MRSVRLISLATLLLCMLWGLVGSRAEAANSNRVEIIVNPALYAGGQISDSLNMYMRDIAYQGYTSVLTTTNFATASDLRTHLASQYNSSSGLAGAVFVGDLPVAKYHVDARNPFPAETFPCDLYYQNLSGTWGDSNSDGVFDSLTGTSVPQIWMGRLTVSTLTGLQSGRTEAGMLNAYLARNHAYRTRQLSLSTNGLAYIDDDWAMYGWENNMQQGVSGTVTAVTNGATTTAVDYKARLQTQYEQVLLAAHSAATFTQFNIGANSTGGYVYSSDLQSVNPQTFFYNLFTCSAANFQTSGYMAGEYAFGTNLGLLAVSSSKVGGMLDYQSYYSPLGQGQTFGDAWKNWLTAEADGGFDPNEIMWDFGMIMLGDPLLTTQAWRPVPKADVNGDNMVNAADIDAIYAHIGGVNSTYDLNNDGAVNQADVDSILKTLLHINYGDANLDGHVDFIDFQALLDHWQGAGGWTQGDFDGSGIVEFVDFQWLLDNWDPSGVRISATPEPATAAILSLGALSLLRRKRR